MFVFLRFCEQCSGVKTCVWKFTSLLKRRIFARYSCSAQSTASRTFLGGPEQSLRFAHRKRLSSTPAERTSVSKSILSRPSLLRKSRLTKRAILYKESSNNLFILFIYIFFKIFQKFTLNLLDCSKMPSKSEVICRFLAKRALAFDKFYPKGKTLCPNSK